MCISIIVVPILRLIIRLVVRLIILTFIRVVILLALFAHITSVVLIGIYVVIVIFLWFILMDLVVAIQGKQFQLFKAEDVTFDQGLYVLRDVLDGVPIGSGSVVLVFGIGRWHRFCSFVEGPNSNVWRGDKLEAVEVSAVRSPVHLIPSRSVWNWSVP